MATVYNAGVFLAKLWNNEAMIDPSVRAMSLYNLFEYNLAPVGARTVSVPIMGSFTANDMSSNAVVDQAGSETAIELVLDKFKHVSVIVRDLDELQSDGGVERRLRTLGGMTQALLKRIDTDIITAIKAVTPATGQTLANSTQADWIDLGASGDTPDQVMAKIEGLMLRAGAVLDRADIVAEDRSFLLIPEFKELALKTSKWGSAEYVGRPNLIVGEFGQAFGSRVVSRNDLARTYVAVNGQVPHHTIVSCFLAHRSILACGIQQQPRVQGEYSLENLGTRVVADTVYGTKEAVTGCLVKINYYFAGDPWSLAP
jgi:hypothetical protein